MGIIAGKKARLYINELDVYLRTFEMSSNLELITEESGVYGDEWEQAEVIMGRSSLEVRARMAQYSPGGIPQPVDRFFREVIFDDSGQPSSPVVLVSTPMTHTMVIRGVAPVQGDNSIFGRGFGRLDLSAVRNELEALRFGVTGHGPIDLGRILDIKDRSPTSAVPALSDDGADVPIQAGAPTEKIRLALHVISFTGAAANITITVESDTATGFPLPTTRATFTVVTGVTHEWLEIPLVGVTDDWWRVKYVSDDVSSSTLGIVCSIKID
ncbi:hypothetical protein LCGC14_2119740 [marine sediment metagenome]|uniref:Uncharacterized protein n=1 Tax=marine sediment metagenome TaxID=412755 RepID=A0A0F9E4M0_9ZZZZ